MKRNTLYPLLCLLFLGFGINLSAQADMRSSGPTSGTRLLEFNDQHKGFFLEFGYLAGHSQHAASYTTKLFGVVKHYPGFRAITLEVSPGWGISKQVVFMGNLKASPGNATFSPYRSLYTGFALAFYPLKRIEWSLEAGSGFYQSSVGKSQVAGKGWLLDLASSIGVSRHVALKAMLLSGKLSTDEMYEFPFRSHELNLSLGVFWYLY